MRRTPWSRAKAVISCQNGMASAHWRSSRATASGGHGYQTQSMVVAAGPSPGHPDIVTILSTPSWPASVMASRMSCAWASPTRGCSGQAEQLRAAMRRPRSANAAAKRSRADRSASRSAMRMCGAGDWPPAAISIPVAPMRAARSSASSNDSRSTESVYKPRSTSALLGLPGCRTCPAVTPGSRAARSYVPVPRRPLGQRDGRVAAAGRRSRRSPPTGRPRASLPGCGDPAPRKRWVGVRRATASAKSRTMHRIGSSPRELALDPMPALCHGPPVARRARTHRSPRRGS